ncbi:hypothetical protein STRAU_0522 [Streptomyces aurantiacus JA 4570]|uniref:Uncharacterized protein n=1 Tax=Streptomyces aurantiacus JA 4570 TaxID=1286094 RepID=S4A710_9ACTN|nr:hypothetical protein STRAU_0522 [Streptomyces aurantiacus JA 4570]
MGGGGALGTLKIGFATLGTSDLSRLIDVLVRHL